MEGARKFYLRSILALMIRVGALVFSFAALIIMARTVGAEEFGAISVFLSLAAILGIPVQSGMIVWLVRASSSHGLLCLKQYLKHYNALVRYFLFVFVCLAFLLTALSLFGIGRFKGVGFSLCLYIFIFITSLSLVFGALLRGAGGVIAGGLGDGFLRPFSLLVFVVCLSLISVLDFQSGLYYLSIILASLLGLTFSALLLIWRGQGGGSFHEYVPVDLRGLKTLSISGGGMVLFANIDILLVDWVVGGAAAGVYRLMVQIGGIGGIFLMVINQLIQPRLSRYINEGRELELKLILRRSVLSCFLFAIIFFVFCGLLGEEVVSFALGNTSIKAWDILMVLAFAQLCNSCFGSVGTVLNMGKFEKEVLIGVSIGVVVNIFTSLILLKFLGSIGAAYGSLIALLIWNVILYRYVNLRLGIDTSVLSLFTRVGLKV